MTLFECIAFIARVLPVRFVTTFIEPLVGAMLIIQVGFVTEVWLAVNPVCSWIVYYYKWLQHGKWSWVVVGVWVARVMVPSD